MGSKRWLSPWKDSLVKPAIYHCISRVVDRRFVFEDAEREHFRMFMRMQENFSGCRVLSYCIMSNHFHILLEVPPRPEGGLTDEELLKRLSATNSEAFVAVVAKELAEARAEGRDEWVAEIHARFTYRMHDLSEFMKTLLQRFTRWFNRTHQRTGTLWEERFKSVIVESGVAARTMAAYIDLNPVRAGMVSDPAEYRWSSYGEAVGGGGEGKWEEGAGGTGEGVHEPSRSGLRGGALAGSFADLSAGDGSGAGPEKRPGGGGQGQGRRPQLNTAEALEMPDNGTLLPDLALAKMLRCRVRYFTDGAVIGSKEFVNETFARARERFGPKRKDGARRMKGNGKAAAGVLWSARDLRVRLG